MTEKGMLWRLWLFPIFLSFALGWGSREKTSSLFSSTPSLECANSGDCLFSSSNCPHGGRWRRKCRLVTEPFPPQLHCQSRCPVRLPNPCRTPAWMAGRRLGLSSLQSPILLAVPECPNLSLSKGDNTQSTCPGCCNHTCSARENQSELAYDSSLCFLNQSSPNK